MKGPHNWNNFSSSASVLMFCEIFVKGVVGNSVDLKVLKLFVFFNHREWNFKDRYEYISV